MLDGPRFQSPNEIILTAENAEECQGRFLFAEPTINPFNGVPHGHASEIVVVSPAKSIAVGAALIHGVEAWAIAHGFLTVTLHIFPESSRAQSMYERLG